MFLQIIRSLKKGFQPYDLILEPMSSVSRVKQRYELLYMPQFVLPSYSYFALSYVIWASGGLPKSVQV